MYCTVKEIIRDVLDTDVPDSECVFAVVLTRGDVRHIARDWNLSDDELETVMQRLDDCMPSGVRTGATVTHSSGKNAKRWTLCYRRWTGRTCHEYQHRNPRNSAQLQSRD